MNVSELKKFYETELGKYTCLRLRHKIHQFWPHASKEKILGFGFALPYLPVFSYGNSCLAIMPPTIGAMKVEGGCSCVMADGLMLPSQNEFYDRVMVIHGIENCEIPEKFLEEVWRVLKPSGKLLMVVPNDGSLWQKAKTPFYKSQGYSKSKLNDYLTYNKFAPKRLRRELFCVPTKYMFFNNIMEFIGKIFFREYCGVLIVEAEKLIFASGGRPIKIAPSMWDKVFRPKPALEV